ncbi:nuclear transport factor 2 family protein (plasmid) [Rhizobium sp. YTUHZ045]|uniref:nuclear transport factor 2 family protein n=1 Tax=Rhizobium sp. YTUHZ045 TaxID=2962888 RepID=UPI003DA85451
MAILQVTKTKLNRIVLLAAASAALLCSGPTAWSQSGCADPTLNRDWSAAVSNPGPADRQAAMDLIHQYYWAVDEQNAAAIARMFTADASYEVCSGGGSLQLKKTLGPEQLATYLKGLFFDLQNRTSRVRHFESNTLLHVADPKMIDRIEVKSAIITTIQRSDLEVPALDYSAVMKAVLVRDGGVWKFSMMTLTTDEPEIMARAR